MRSFYGLDRWDNAYFISENFSEALIEKDFLFINSVTQAGLQALGSQNTLIKKIKALPSSGPVSPIQTLAAQHVQELALVVFAPPIVANNDFVFVLDDLQRSKFNICSILRLPSTSHLEQEDIQFLFAEQTPRFFNLEALESLIFKQDGGVVMVVVEKEKAVQELNEIVGKVEIKSKNDLQKYQKKSAAPSMMMFGSSYDQQ